MTGTLTCSTTAVTASPVGSYPITSCSGLADDGFNVVYDYAGSSYTVTKAPLTVTADDQSRLFGAANPPLTATLSGFVLGQTLATSGVTGQASCTTTATPFSPGGGYPITCTQGIADARELQLRAVRPGHAHGRPTRGRVSRARCRSSSYGAGVSRSASARARS